MVRQQHLVSFRIVIRERISSLFIRSRVRLFEPRSRALESSRLARILASRRPHTSTRDAHASRSRLSHRTRVRIA